MKAFEPDKTAQTAAILMRRVLGEELFHKVTEVEMTALGGALFMASVGGEEYTVTINPGRVILLALGDG